LLLDKIGELVGSGAAAIVYSALLKETNSQMAVKSYNPTENGFSIECDMSTEYTLNYEDSFVAGELQCVVMKLMKTSLEKFRFLI
jgi:hypothetical protein